MAGIFKTSFDRSQDVRAFEGNTGELRMIDLDGSPVGMATFRAGWRWSDHVKPIAGTSSCQAPHLGYVVTGHMTVRMDDGTEENFSPGDLMRIDPGHDAWVVGQEDCVLIDWQGYANYAKPTTAQASAQA